jgi:hypothetical protein
MEGTRGERNIDINCEKHENISAKIHGRKWEVDER